MLLFANHSIFSPVSWERFVLFDRRETSFAASTQIACVSLQMRSKDWYAWNRRIKKRCLRLQCTLGANYRIRAKKNKRKATPGSNPARGGFLERYFRFFFYFDSNSQVILYIFSHVNMKARILIFSQEFSKDRGNRIISLREYEGSNPDFQPGV